MARPVDPNNVLMTGETSGIRLSLDGGMTLSTRMSHWRVLWCVAGAVVGDVGEAPGRGRSCRSG